MTRYDEISTLKNFLEPLKIFMVYVVEFSPPFGIFLMLLVKGMDREKRGDRGERGEREQRERAQKETMRIRGPGRQGS